MAENESAKTTPTGEPSAPPPPAEAPAEIPAAKAPEPAAAPAAPAPAAAAEPAPPAPPAEAAPAPEAEGQPKIGATYVWGTGRRKSAIARVRIRPGTGKILVNKRELDDYFPSDQDRRSARSPLVAAGITSRYDVWVNVTGGGTTGQADAVKLGLARALIKAQPDVTLALREAGLLTRDARMKERKKYGQKGARKRFQFSKR